jgi:hypothetical protein
MHDGSWLNLGPICRASSTRPRLRVASPPTGLLPTIWMAASEPEPEPEREREPESGGAAEAAAVALEREHERKKKKKKKKHEQGLWPYVIVNSSYLLFTVTDGAVRMMVLLHARTLNFTAWEIAMMFTLYEAAGVVTNLLAGVAGARWGIKATLMAGLTLQLGGLGMLLGWRNEWDKSTAITYVTLAQMLCGIAKDLVKLGGKTVAKLVTPDEQKGQLFQLVAAVTGWKNSLKGAGYFLGSVLLLWDSGPNGTWGAVFVLMAIIVIADATAANRMPRSARCSRCPQTPPTKTGRTTGIATGCHLGAAFSSRRGTAGSRCRCRSICETQSWDLAGLIQRPGRFWGDTSSAMGRCRPTR